MQTIYEDTRQKPDKHNRKNLWWKAHGVTVVRRKLDFGDYMVNGSNISVDTKRNMQEICGNLGRDHQRVVREVERARSEGYRLVFLIDTVSNVREIADVANWTNDVCRRCQHRRAGFCDPSTSRCMSFKRKPMQGATLARIMAGMERDHGCVFEFVHPMMAAKVVCDILGVRYT